MIDVQLFVVLLESLKQPTYLLLLLLGLSSLAHDPGYVSVQQK